VVHPRLPILCKEIHKIMGSWESIEVAEDYLRTEGWKQDGFWQFAAHRPTIGFFVRGAYTAHVQVLEPPE